MHASLASTFININKLRMHHNMQERVAKLQKQLVNSLILNCRRVWNAKNFQWWANHWSPTNTIELCSNFPFLVFLPTGLIYIGIFMMGPKLFVFLQSRAALRNVSGLLLWMESHGKYKILYNNNLRPLGCVKIVPHSIFFVTLTCTNTNTGRKREAPTQTCCLDAFSWRPLHPLNPNSWVRFLAQKYAH